MSGSHEVNRRDFVTVVTAFIGTLIGAVIGLPAIGFLLSPAARRQATEARVAVGSLENYPEGTPTLFNFTRTKINGWEKTVNSYGVYILRQGGEVKVFSNICTHLSCRVVWRDEFQFYHCPCHDADFDINGEIVKGPQPRPLDEYPVTIEDGNIFITFTGG
jgi:menaquinol-cytochrome c reductase iron-sulfur subunit